MLGRVTFDPIDSIWKFVVQIHVFVHVIRPLRHFGGHEDGGHLIFKADSLGHWFHAKYLC